MLEELYEDSVLSWRSESIESSMHDWRSQNRSFVLATVIESGGSTPRLNGASLVCDGHTFAGTIGGGAVEKKVLSECVRLLDSDERTKTINVHLVRDLAMCCGGNMTIFLNKTEASPDLVVFGAGHIGQALAKLSKETDFTVTVVDERSEWLNAERFGSDISCADEDPISYARSAGISNSTYCLVVTHAHDLDQSIIEKLITQTNKPSFIGLIGSKGKWARFRSRLLAKGISEDQLAAVYCPCGLDIGSETPTEIAVSVLAQMIQHYRCGLTS